MKREADADADADAHIGATGYVVSSPAVATVAVAAPTVAVAAPAVASHAVAEPTCTAVTERVCNQVKKWCWWSNYGKLWWNSDNQSHQFLLQVPVESAHKVARQVSAIH